MGENTARLQVGRLLEIRIAAGCGTIADADQLFDSVERELAKLPPGEKHITVTDMRRCPLMAPTAAAQVALRVAELSGSTLRGAALASETAPVAVLQFSRVIREANSPVRRLFFDDSQLTKWLSEELTAAEAARLRLFIASDDHG